MTVKTGVSWSGTFVTIDATGALATPSVGPVGVLYVDGTANGAAVTISGANPYKFTLTVPALTAGQRVDMYITATISLIATAAIVASEQSDTVLTSDINTLIGVAGAGLTNINLPDQTMNITGNITGNLSGSVGSVAGNVTGTIGGMAATALADFFDTDSGETSATAINGSVVAEIADLVWDELIAGHLGVGSTGEALAAAGGAGDPWLTLLPGAYLPGTAGDIIGNLTPTVFPTGAINFTYTVTDSVTLLPIEGVEVWISTDNPAVNIVWKGDTDAFGVARDVNGNLPALDVGVYFFWRQKAGYTFVDPDTETAS